MENISRKKMEDSSVNAESIQKALSEINTESAKILEEIKKTTSLNEEGLSDFSRKLKLFNDELGVFFPKLSLRDSLYSTQSSFLPPLVHTRNEEKGT
jgi:hypothetical protein